MTSHARGLYHVSNNVNTQSLKLTSVFGVASSDGVVTDSLMFLLLVTNPDLPSILAATSLALGVALSISDVRSYPYSENTIRPFLLTDCFKFISPLMNLFYLFFNQLKLTNQNKNKLGESFYAFK